MLWNTPLSEAHADQLLLRLAPGPDTTVLDLGCGWGELLLRAVKLGGGTGTGVDTDAVLLARGRALARERGLDVTFVEHDAATWTGPADRVICLGSSHALGGTAAALATLAGVIRPGGRLLVGEPYWERTPGPEAVEIFGPDVPDLPGLAGQIRASGWRVLHLSTAGLAEWDDFESTYRAGREEWLLANPDHPEADGLRAELDHRLDEYLTVYRGVINLAYAILAR